MVNKRLSLGWSFEKAIFTPKRVRDKESLIGQKFNKLTVLEFSKVGNRRKSFFKCICDCGNIVVVDRQKLLSGHTRSCGCIRKQA